jgi:hypothetical protein
MAGIENVDPGLRLELMPYVTGGLTSESRERFTAGDPFADEFRLGGRLGMDLKMGLGSHLTLDGTINPDFGQIEADPAQVNLTAFDTFLEERRPFFIEGSRLLEGRGPQYFYSRRIGGPPAFEPTAEFVDAPQAVNILGAGKVTGRLPSGLSVGALTAVTQRTRARLGSSDGSPVQQQTLAPLTSYTVLRLEQQLGTGASIVGASLTNTYRALGNDDVLADQLARESLTGGADWSLRLNNSEYEVSGHAGLSAVHGRPSAISFIASESAHYFQRPDQDHVSLSEDRTWLLGTAAALGVEKRSGIWRWKLRSNLESPGFELNDVGRLDSADNLGVYAQASYLDTTARWLFREWSASFDTTHAWNFGGVRKPPSMSASLVGVWQNFWSTGLKGRLLFPGLDDDLTRGGPLAGRGWSGQGSLSFASAFAAKTSWNGEVAYVADKTGTSGLMLKGNLSLSPMERMSLSLTPRYSAVTNNRQYVETLVADGRPDTFGHRYIFATIKQRELAVQLRLQVAFKPELSVETYLEPFLSSGRYSNVGELPSPRSRELLLYGEGGTSIERQDDGAYLVTEGARSFLVQNAADFTVLSLRGTAVLRWEFLPGSTVSLAWQHDRYEEQSVAE